MSAEKVIEQLANNPELIPLAADHLDAAGFAKQMLLRRQRVQAARRRLERAKKSGASDAEITRLDRLLAIREDGLTRAKASFEKANVRRPVPDPERGQVFVYVEGQESGQSLSAALVSEGKLVTHAELTKEGFALLTTDRVMTDLQLQISSKRTIVFRDAGSFELELGEVVYRHVNLTLPDIAPEPPSTRLIMPDLSGQSKRTAVVLLERIGITSVNITEKVGVGPEDVVIEQAPAAGEELTDETRVSLIISKRRLVEGEDERFLPELARLIESDDRWKELSIAGQQTRRVLANGGIRNRETLTAVLKLDTERLQDRFKLASLEEAVIFQSVLSKAGKAVD